MKTTLNKIREHKPCTSGWEKLLSYLGKTKSDDEPLEITTILDSNGLDDAIWCLRAVAGKDREVRLFAVWCARQVQHVMTDQRSLDALDVAERYANGEATEKEMDAARAAARNAASAATRNAAWDAAWSAAGAAEAAGAAAWGAAEAAGAARAAAWSAARYAAWAAADVADDAAMYAANATAYAAWAAGAAEAAAVEAAREKQEAELRRICGEG